VLNCEARWLLCQGQLSKATVGLFGFLFTRVKGKMPDRAIVSGLSTLGRDESVVRPVPTPKNDKELAKRERTKQRQQTTASR